MLPLEYHNKFFNKKYSFINPSIKESKKLDELESKNLISTKSEKIYKCVNIQDKDYKYLDDEQLICSGNMYEEKGILICDTCSREENIDLKTPIKIERIINHVNYNKLEELIRDNLNKIEKRDKKIKRIRKVRSKSAWNIKYDDIELQVILLDNVGGLFSVNLPILHKESIFIGFGEKFIDEEIINGINLLDNNNHNILWKEIKSKLIENNNNDYAKLEELINLIDKNIKGKDDWSFFEKEFSNLFIKSLKENTSKLKDYFYFLESNKNNLKGSMIVNLGGASNPDIQILSKYKYYKVLLKSNINWDPKCYIAGKITTEEVQQVWFQMSSSGAEGGVIFTLSNNITADVWTETKKVNERADGEIRIVPKNIIYEFIYYMEKEKEFINLVREYIQSSN